MRDYKGTTTYVERTVQVREDLAEIANDNFPIVPCSREMAIDRMSPLSSTTGPVRARVDASRNEMDWLTKVAMNLQLGARARE